MAAALVEERAAEQRRLDALVRAKEAAEQKMREELALMGAKLRAEQEQVGAGAAAGRAGARARSARQTMEDADGSSCGLRD